MDREIGNKMEFETRNGREIGNKTEFETRNGCKWETRRDTLFFNEKTRKTGKTGGKNTKKRGKKHLKTGGKKQKITRNTETRFRRGFGKC